MEDSIKIILVGQNVGKSSFIRNLKGEPFDRGYEPTYGGYKQVPILLGENEDENKKLSVILYDTSGQELYDKSELYKNADCAIFFFKKSSMMSFNYAKQELVKYRLIKKSLGKTPICVLYDVQSDEHPKIKSEDITKLKVDYYIGSSNKRAGSAYNVLVKTLRLLYISLLPIKNTTPKINEALSSIMTEEGLIDIVDQYDDDGSYWKKLKTFVTSHHFNFSSKQSRRKRSVRKQSPRKRSVRKQSPRKKSVRKQSPRKKSVRKQSRRLRSVRKQSRRRRSVRKN